MSVGEGLELPPVAPMLMESLRAVGYTTSAALADLVDNSVAAHASRVEILFSAGHQPYLAILDNGDGLTQDKLQAAMRFGSSDPRERRNGMDLGRFGLGLKTASLSQCRSLTVASLVDGHVATAQWDLDECEQRATWWLSRPHLASLPDGLVARLQGAGRGTIVLWRKLDRMIRGVDTARGIEVSLAEASDHLAMVFHRFLAQEFGAFEIVVNNRPLPRLDPFLEGHSRGQSLHSEAFAIEGQVVKVSPFVLPFPSRLHHNELERVGGRESLKTSHGFYVYRGGRLVVPGGWFRIVPADELVRLARVRVDVPVELDHLWKVDIRKTIAEPPVALRPELKRIVGAVTIRSRRVYSHRGTPVEGLTGTHIWSRHDSRDGGAAWKINRDHPLIRILLSQDSSPQDSERILRVMENSLPVHDIHLHISNDMPLAEEVQTSDEELELLASRLFSALRDQPESLARLLAELPRTEPFSRDPERARRIVEKLRS